MKIKCYLIIRNNYCEIIKKIINMLLSQNSMYLNNWIGLDLLPIFINFIFIIYLYKY